MWSVSQNASFLQKDEIKSELLCCRGCLGSGRLFNMSRYGLTEAYHQLVGIEVRDTNLPQHLCHFCRMLLVKFAQFRERCRRADTLLQSLALLTPAITADDISTIDRNTENLSHTYGHTNINIVTCSGLDTQDTLAQDTFTQGTFAQDSIAQCTLAQGKLEQCTLAQGTHAQCTFAQGTHEQCTLPQDTYAQDALDQDTFPQDDYTDDYKEMDFEEKCKLDFIEAEMLDIVPIKRTRKRKSKKEVIEDAEDLEVKEEKKKIRKNAKPRVNNLYTDPEDRLKFSQKYDVDIIVMTKDDEYNDMLQRKNSPKYLRAHNKCEQCYKGFIHEDTLKRHVKDKHDPSLEHACEFCRFRFGKRVNLTGHYRRHHKYKYVCRVCAVVTRMREHAVQHSKMHTQKFECKYCGKTFNTKGTTYHAHVRSAHGSQLPWCRVCGDAFVCTKTHQERLHKETLAPSPELRCSCCATQFLSAPALRAHSLAHAQCAGVQWCLHCGRGFELEAALREHVLAVHKVHFPCDKCNKTFSHESKLNNHMLEKHPEEHGEGEGGEGGQRGRKRYMKVVPAMCDICGKIIADQYHMVYHQRIHTGEKPYECNECPKKFRMPEQLQNHTRIHTGERPFKCKYCPNTFKTYPAMARHHLVHTGVRRYPCSVCGKPFATSAEMKSHVRTVHMKLPPPPRHRRNRND